MENILEECIYTYNWITLLYNSKLTQLYNSTILQKKKLKNEMICVISSLKLTSSNWREKSPRHSLKWLQITSY